MELEESLRAVVPHWQAWAANGEQIIVLQVGPTLSPGTRKVSQTQKVDEATNSISITALVLLEQAKAYRLHAEQYFFVSLKASATDEFVLEHLKTFDCPNLKPTSR